jgi:hypothetical protein
MIGGADLCGSAEPGGVWLGESESWRADRGALPPSRIRARRTSPGDGALMFSRSLNKKRDYESQLLAGGVPPQSRLVQENMVGF